MDVFYVIKGVKKNGEFGYLIDAAEGVEFVVGAYNIYVTQFKTYQKAQHFIRKIKHDAWDLEFYIQSNSDILKEVENGTLDGIKASPVSDNMCYMENEQGEKLCFDTKENGYYFDDVTVGYCCWKSTEQAEALIKAYDLPGIIIKQFNEKHHDASK